MYRIGVAIIAVIAAAAIAPCIHSAHHLLLVERDGLLEIKGSRINN